MEKNFQANVKYIAVEDEIDAKSFYVLLLFEFVELPARAFTCFEHLSAGLKISIARDKRTERENVEGTGNFVLFKYVPDIIEELEPLSIDNVT